MTKKSKPSKEDPDRDREKIIYDIQVENIRLDYFIAQYFSEKDIPISRNIIQDLIKQGKVSVNKSPVKKPSYKLKPGDVILCPNTPPEQFSELIPQDIPITVIFEDEDLMIVYKPYNLVVHPATGHPDGTLANALAFYLSSRAPGEPHRPGLVHRLDKDTTGLMIVAKSLRAFSKLQLMIKRREVNRIYLTMVHGIIANQEARIETPFGKSVKDGKKFSVHTHKPRIAISEYSVIQNFKDFTFVKFKLITGRTHQIRVHMSTLGHPVVGDITYGKAGRVIEVHDRKFRFEHHLLHAAILDFDHPVTGKRLSFEFPLPEQFEEFLLFLREKEYGKKS